MASASSVDVVLVNWNSGAQLRVAVDSVLSNPIGNGAVNIFVVDNGSRDDSLSGLDSLSRVRMQRNQKNIGFAAACNHGAALGDGAFILFLNPDAAVFPNAIRQSVEFMRRPENACVGICGIQLVDAARNTHRHCARFPTWRTYIGLAFGLSHVLPRFFPPHFMTTFDHKTSREVDQVIGAYFLVRRVTFEELGGFDERFFVYFEDLDFSLRARQAGWRTWYLADVRAYHKGGGTSERAKAHRLFYSLRSRILYGFKHFPLPAAWGVLALTLGVEPVTRLIRGALRRSFRELSDTVRAYYMLWRDIRNVVKTVVTNR